MIGNDVVGLGHPRCTNRPPGDRLLRRILADGEEAWLEEGAPEARRIRLWSLWAAKEAAYKVHCQMGLEAGRVFRPRTLVSRLAVAPMTGAGPDASLGVRGRVALAGSDRGGVWIEGAAAGDCLHVVAGVDRPDAQGGRLDSGTASSPDRAGSDDAAELREMAALRTRFSEEEWDGIRSLPSARVRLLARARLERAVEGLGKEGRVEILTPRTGVRGLRRAAPKVRVGGRLHPEVGVSLSHHGRYLAWAIRLPPETTTGTDH
jgi:phosphopantetheinyl transferase (holo-ACP synthase)